MYPLCALNPWTSTITARGVPFGPHDRVKTFRPSAVLKDDSFMLPPLCSNDSKPVVAGVGKRRGPEGLVALEPQPGATQGVGPAAKPAVASLQPMLQFGRGVPEERPSRGFVCEPVQQAEIVDRAVVANGRRLHAGLVELPTVGLAFVAQDVVLGDLDQRRGQPLQLFEARSQR